MSLKEENFTDTKRILSDTIAELGRVKAERDELAAALRTELSSGLAMLEILSQAYDRFTDNDMMPPNHKLSVWLSSAAICLERRERMHADLEQLGKKG